MSIQISLERATNACRFVPLAVVGYCLTRSGVLPRLWSGIEVDMKERDHAPHDKLQDVLVAIMAGCSTLAQVNTRLRPEGVLATAWQRATFAEQSGLSRLLDALHAEQIDQLRLGNLSLLKQFSQVRHHPRDQLLLLDVDSTSLLASKRAEGSRKGWVSGKRNQYCRHLLRFTLAGYHESLLSLAYPGDRHGYEYFKSALQTLLAQWPWRRMAHRRIILRSDAELGTDENVRYVLWQNFQILMKGYSGRRTQAWLEHLAPEAWQADPRRPDHWAAPAPVRLRMGRHVDAYLLRWLDSRGELDHATLLSTLPYPIFVLWDIYDGRGADEVEIRSDKSGLQLTHRRKQSLCAQEAWIVLTDIAHNLLAWLRPWMLAGSPFEEFGPQRIVRDLMCIPGRLTFKGEKLQKVALLKTHPYAAEMQFCLQKMLENFDLA